MKQFTLFFRISIMIFSVFSLRAEEFELLNKLPVSVEFAVGSGSKPLAGTYKMNKLALTELKAGSKSQTLTVANKDFPQVLIREKNKPDIAYLYEISAKPGKKIFIRILDNGKGPVVEPQTWVANSLTKDDIKLLNTIGVFEKGNAPKNEKPSAVATVEKVDLARSGKLFNEALSNYIADTMEQMDIYAKMAKSGIFSKKPDPAKRFKETQEAYNALIRAINSNIQQAKSERSTIEKGMAGLRTQLGELRLIESLLLRRSSGLYDQIVETYRNNEQKMPASLRLTAEKVYPFLSVTNEKGKEMSLDEINNNLKTMRGLMGGDKAERDSLFRQLQFYFQHRYSKQEFDAFLDGKNAIKALELSRDIIALIQERFMELPTITGWLDDIQDMVK